MSDLAKMTFSILGCFAGLAGAPEPAAAQQDIAITIYNQDIALVHVTRRMPVGTGVSEVRFSDVAAAIDPTSVQISVKDDAGSLKILEQNFEFDLVGAAKLYTKYLGQEVALTTKNSGTITGQLLNAGSDLVLQQEDGSIKVVSRNEVTTTDFPKLPEGLIVRPTLVWLADNSGAPERDMEVSYLTRGVSWQAQYVGVLSEDEKKMKFNGWVSVDNRSGATYDNAKLKLVAGEVNLIQANRIQTRMAVQSMRPMAEADQPFEEKDFFEYHLYTLQRPSTLRDSQIKQITFIPGTEASVKKQFVYDHRIDARNASVFVEFNNSRKSGLGMPLPAGTVRVFKADSDDALLLLGEDRIRHTPRNEDVRLRIGKAFDLIAERNQLEQRQLGKRTREEQYEIVLRNHKKTAALVTVVEHFQGDWEIRNASQNAAKKTATKAEWQIRVPADGSTTLTFTILRRW